MTLRARVAAVITLVLLLLGLAAGTQANASETPTTGKNGCVLVVPLQVGVCIDRF